MSLLTFRTVAALVLAGTLAPAQTDRAPAFSFTTGSGKHIGRDDFGGRILVLNFWETARVPCVRELPSLSQFAREFQREGVVVVAVSGDRDAGKYRRFLRDHRVELETYRDPDRRISRSFGTLVFPETYIVQGGRIIRKVVGAIDWQGAEIAAFVRSAAQAPGKPPEDHDSERRAYDEIYAQGELFRTAPNAFLVRTIAGRKPGRALDVGMGQGRNALWLASQGWDVTGFDISPVGIAQARNEAEARGLHIDTYVTPYEDFSWGKEQWDLIVFSYFFPRAALPKVWDSLRPGGLILIEGFHADTARVRPIGGGYHDNELFQVLKDYRLLLYEDVQDRQEWGLPFGATNRLVRVLAEKRIPLPPGCSWQEKSYRPGESMCWGVSRWTCGAEGWESGPGKCAP
jgi:SAM-dependent methyltransferase